MKKILIIAMSLLLTGHNLILFAASPVMTIRITGVNAKSIYLALTGHKVKHDAAMSHQYRQGQGITCQYVIADMDVNGRPVAMQDSKRYSCTIQVNQNGIQ